MVNRIPEIFALLFGVYWSLLAQSVELSAFICLAYSIFVQISVAVNGESRISEMAKCRRYFLPTQPNAEKKNRACIINRSFKKTPQTKGQTKRVYRHGIASEKHNLYLSVKNRL